MAKEYDINDPIIHRCVLRGLVSYGYSQIRKIYYASNINLKKSDSQKTIDIKNINDTIGGCFLSLSSFQTATICVNTKNWQDYLNCNDLFHLFIFQSAIIKNVSNLNKSLEVKDFDKVVSLKQVYKWIPEKIKLEDEKMSLPAKDTLKRDFINRFDVREKVLTREIFNNLKEENFSEKDALHVKNFIEKSGCFEKYSGLVAQSFFSVAKNQIEDEKQERIFQAQDDFYIIGGYNTLKVVGKTFDGETLYESEDGTDIGTLSEGNYKGTIYKAVEDEKNDDIIFVPVSTTDEYFEKNNTIVKEENPEQ